ncbi:PAS domain S-box-containing protein [Desulfacinum hydrothermale DSM 13146]|uniref:histidine kinase n=1 Tax=Desulfacinum hydrothermale DSM 13146 TaxID=1121390 RepID=A0A1W1X536_9BACT|nr:PAS domain-containing sensor histidine kinase [Desulfacinum hydrothermale]SMC18838.1 PAS domain S-box-containing protein [Desulfacinum hydrothermale DSM 13146]
MEFLERLRLKTSISVVSLSLIFFVVAAAWLGIRTAILPALDTAVKEDLMDLGRLLDRWAAEKRWWGARSGRELENRLGFYPGYRYVTVETQAGRPFFRAGDVPARDAIKWRLQDRRGPVVLRRCTDCGRDLFEVVVTPDSPESSAHGMILRVGVEAGLMWPMRQKLFLTLASVTALILVVGFFVSRWFTDRITRPVRELLAMTDLMARGRLQEVIERGEPMPACKKRLEPSTWARTLPTDAGTCPHLVDDAGAVVGGRWPWEGFSLFPIRRQNDAESGLSEVCRECPVLEKAGANELTRLILSFRFMAAELRAYQERLRRRYEFEERLLEACPDGIMASDHQGTIILYNKGAERLLGYTATEAVYGLNAGDIYPEDGARRVKAALLSDEYGGPGVLVDYTTEVLTKEGRRVPIRLSATRLEEDGGRFSIVGYFHDLSEIKAHMNALVAANRELNSANRELERLNRYYLEMISFVTHELKSPIANGYMSANALRQEIFGPLVPEQKAMVDAICANLEQSMEMIRHYLDLSRIEKDEFPVHPKSVRLDEEIVQPVLQGLEPAIRQKGMEVEKNMPTDLSWALDPELFRGVLTNLLSNAVKYGENQGKVRVSAFETAHGRLRLEVWNSGPGLSAEDQSKLFRRFQRLPSARRSATRGTGLGLFIAKTIVERHGGRIWVESSKGEGVNFIVEVPSGVNQGPDAPRHGEGVE